ncbi:hypothetical protein TOPH_01642 [Tolypocladium ophioglossoides CBS 100239]|uniref:DUF676 domain-containing protein n=1 Tax=Tolypocladium ophioglossoides (strain CBS 100239) TaxID=1163406 RepID=A0A0L0NJ07_TOLOC|nr:hypothetical protein TOPH_01642 [Tolypocladium ophioglossoides CBS 100239]
MASPPPPLPPRGPSVESRPVPDLGSPSGGRISPDHLGPDYDDSPSLGWLAADPRSSSTQSLVPSVRDSDPRRRLLVVYIHGFYGNDQSFRSFPAHLHSLLRTLLADSHVIHSKIYPRYKTYKAIEVARDNFSTWLEPHESPTTDVLLVGHSMGGLLAGEVALMPNHSPYRQQAFKHRILGTLSLDSPFLGLHPGIVVSGISSLFQPGPKPPQDHQDASSTAASPLSSLEPTPSIDSRLESPSSSISSPPSRRDTDPYFDPPFWNDEPFREQPFIKRVMHFTSKHKSEGIFNAVRSHMVSHLEFGGCLADYRGLVSRYNRLRALEDVDEVQAASDGHPPVAYARVRFVSYYTLSSGRRKPPKCPPLSAGVPSETDVASISQSDLDMTSQLEDGGAKSEDEAASSPISMLEVKDKKQGTAGSDTSTPRISVEAPKSDEHDASVDTTNDQQKNEEQRDSKEAHTPPDVARISMLSMQDIDPRPMDHEDPAPPRQPLMQANLDHLDLPPIPDEPPKPDLPDLEQYTDRDARKQAEKESKRLQKAYDQACKDRTKALREREKLLEKRRKKAQKEAQKEAHKLGKNALKEQQRWEKEQKKQEAAGAKHAAAAAAAAAAGQDGEDGKEGEDGEDSVQRAVEEVRALEAEKPKKMRKFCNLPGKTDGARDRTWVEVYMDGVDEVGAHCGLFASGPHYDQLVGDVGSRVVGWVHDDMSKRAILGMD